MTAEGFGQVWSRDNSDDVLAEIDPDGDGNLASEAWMSSHLEQFASRSEQSGGAISVEDFQLGTATTTPGSRPIRTTNLCLMAPSRRIEPMAVVRQKTPVGLAPGGRFCGARLDPPFRDRTLR
jgi:hypothetical protein